MSENETLNAELGMVKTKLALFEEVGKEYQTLKEEHNKSMTDNDNLRKELEEIKDKEDFIAELEEERKEKELLKKELENQRQRISQVQEIEEKSELVMEELNESVAENEKLNSELAMAAAKLMGFERLQKEYETVNANYTKVLNDNSNMVKQIEELQQKLLQSDTAQDLAYVREQRDHLEREKVNLKSRVDQLEKQCQDLTNQIKDVNQEFLKTESRAQQLEFDNDSLHVQLGLAGNNEKSTKEFHGEYERLQGQFSVAMEQKTQVNQELNQMVHSLKQREARCQQLAMQLLESERKTVNAAMQRAAEADLQKVKAVEEQIIPTESRVAESEVKVKSEPDDAEIYSLKYRLEEAEKTKEQLLESASHLERTLIMEREQRIQLEDTLATAKQIEHAREMKEIQLNIEEEESRIREMSPILLRHESGYFSRLLQWLKIQREYFCLSSCQLKRAMRKRPGIRTMMWGYFFLLHILVMGCK
ncbi:hypothetical protein KUTeg_007235 [Tegillarca granosa]|uniref:Uncharacterized protein n=1 Tax=Tegillarca granosa TaxID=220873 RepID=A0ABQ9FFP0_TEGGR|nr:hypothetical protein KUTeg_007235 [Tegillarca granosa]